MTLKEAIEKAGLDGRIAIAPGGPWIKPSGSYFTPGDVMCTNWEVKREPLVVEWQGEWKYLQGTTVIIPTGVSAEILPMLVGKRTRVRVEEIIEDEK